MWRRFFHTNETFYRTTYFKFHLYSSALPIQPHYEDCKYLSIPCPRRCGAEFEKRFLDKHLKEDCPKRDMTCEFCKSTIAVDEEITHLNVCKRFPIPCPNGCKKKEIPREEVNLKAGSKQTSSKIELPTDVPSILLIITSWIFIKQLRQQ